MKKNINTSTKDIAVGEITVECIVFIKVSIANRKMYNFARCAISSRSYIKCGILWFRSSKIPRNNTVTNDVFPCFCVCVCLFVCLPVALASKLYRDFEEALCRQRPWSRDHSFELL